MTSGHPVAQSDVANYLDSVSERYGFKNDPLCLAFPIWICEMLPSVISAIREARSHAPRTYQNDNDVVNIVPLDDQFLAMSKDKHGFMDILARIYRRYGRLQVAAVHRDWSGLAWLILCDSLRTLPDEGIVAKAIIWLQPRELDRKTDPILWVKIARKVAEYDGSRVQLNQHTPPLKDTGPLQLKEEDWDILGLATGIDRLERLSNWKRDAQVEMNLKHVSW